MKNKIQELIEHHKTAKTEVKNLLEELSQVDEVKLSYQEEVALKELRAKYSEEYSMRGIFIDELENLL